MSHAHMTREKESITDLFSQFARDVNDSLNWFDSSARLVISDFQHLIDVGNTLVDLINQNDENYQAPNVVSQDTAPIAGMNAEDDENESDNTSAPILENLMTGMVHLFSVLSTPDAPEGVRRIGKANLAIQTAWRAYLTQYNITPTLAVKNVDTALDDSVVEDFGDVIAYAMLDGQLTNFSKYNTQEIYVNYGENDAVFTISDGQGDVMIQIGDANQAELLEYPFQYGVLIDIMSDMLDKEHAY